MASFKYSYTKAINTERLTSEINSSPIEVALDYINLIGESNVEVFFRMQLSSIDKVTLDNLISAHINEPLDGYAEVNVKFGKQTPEDGIPYVYSTSRPLGQYVTYFTGAGDNLTTGERGGGDDLVFLINNTDVSISKDVSFSEDVWVKDGFIICRDAPFGASVDIDVVHPLYGVLESFGKKIPVAGTGWFPLDTEDRAFLPKGLIVRITVNNATIETVHEPVPDHWHLAGRLELFRSKQTPT